MAEQLVKLELIKDNPYQDREVYEDIDGLGRAIAMHRLQQTPKARSVNGHFELEFGHRRKRAFEWLVKNWKKEGLPDRYRGYTEMPLDVEDGVTDDVMLDVAIIENAHRADLKVTEKARLLKRYKEVHPDATSDQIGLVFNMSGATVRGYDIFLDLPKQVQEKLDRGEISQGVARSIHSMQRVVPEKQVLKALKDIEEGKDFFGEPIPPEAIIRDAVEDAKNVTELGDWAYKTKSFPNKYLPLIDPGDLEEALQLGIEDKTTQKFYDLFEKYNDQKPDGDYTDVDYSSLKGVDEKYIERVRRLIVPPACLACDLHTVIDGDHFCGLKVCSERKLQAWQRKQLHEKSKELGIAIYDRAEDGEFRVLEENYNSEGEHYRIFKKRSKDLRLAMNVDIDRKKSQYGYGMPSFMSVMLTGKTLKDLLSKRQTERSDERQEKQQKELLAKLLVEKRRLVDWEVTLSLKTLFDAFNLSALETLEDCGKYGQWKLDGSSAPEGQQVFDDAKDAIRADFLRRIYALNMINVADDNSGEYEDDVTSYADWLIETCKEWGVKLPKSVRKMAQEFDAEIQSVVAVETKKK